MVASLKPPSGHDSASVATPFSSNTRVPLFQLQSYHSNWPLTGLPALSCSVIWNVKSPASGPMPSTAEEVSFTMSSTLVCGRGISTVLVVTVGSLPTWMVAVLVISSSASALSFTRTLYEMVWLQPAAAPGKAHTSVVVPSSFAVAVRYWSASPEVTNVRPRDSTSVSTTSAAWSLSLPTTTRKARVSPTWTPALVSVVTVFWATGFLTTLVR